MSSIASATPTKKAFKHLFVYGTLKTGYTNYNRYLRYAKQLGRAILVGPAITKGKYALVLRPPNRLPNTRGPILMKEHQEDESNRHHIQGELWKVDEITIKASNRKREKVCYRWTRLVEKVPKLRFESTNHREQ